jgi:dolichyl-phosphate-mannose--protein O-mannosyl transferase
VTQTAEDIRLSPPSTRPGSTVISRAKGWRLRLAGSDRFWGWAAPILVMLVGGYLRMRHLGRPHRLIFDETYYVKEAASYLRYGHERSLRTSILADADKRNEAADQLFTSGHLDIWGDAPDRVVHPPVGKWMIASGEWLFGPTSSFGWRFASALTGTLAILMIGRIARRLFGSTTLGTTAALLLAVDGQALVLSRTGILDIFVMFWALAAFGCLLIDRDHARTRLLTTVNALPPGTRPRLGPWLGPRPWRLTGITCLALCTGVKWSGLYFTAAFLLASVCWDAAARRAAGIRHWLPGAAALDGLQAFLSMIVILPSVYLAGWTGWLLSTTGYARRWGTDHPADPGWGWVPDALRSLWHYHSEMWHFHVNLEISHPYRSNPWSWMILGRPTAFYFQKEPRGTDGCRASECVQAVTSLGNPVIWWAGTLAVAVLVLRWVLTRDWRAGAVLTGIVGGYLPWFAFQERTIYSFYAVAFLPWVVLALTYTLGLAVGPPELPEHRRRPRAVLAGGTVFLALLAFWFFYPVLSAEQMPYQEWSLRMWFPSWI